MTNKNWFDVDTNGLRQLQLRKPKHYVVRELIQNAFDENIKECRLTTLWQDGLAEIIVKDDNPEGFKNITHAYTLFAPTDKLKNPEKRGRFNMGEKQAISLCEKAIISTTKGTIVFDKTGRHHKSTKTEKGSVVFLLLKISKKEYDEILSTVKKYLVPEKISFIVNEEKIKHQKPLKTIVASLQTETEENQILKKVWRKTKIEIFEMEEPVLFEMGIPVMQTECQYGINVQQKIPLSIDRDTVPESFLKALYAEILNEMCEYISEQDSSQAWIRQATADKRINPDIVKQILNKRYGEKVVIANPFDPNSIDDALSAGYKVITGNEMSKEEWERIRENKLLPSSSEKFGHSFAISKPYSPNENMKKTAEIAKKIAKECLGINISVCFASWTGVSAEYGNRTLTFNVSMLGHRFFDPPLSEQTLDLIIHELGHEKGNHTEKGYHEALTMMAAKLIFLIKKNPSFLE